MNEADTRAELIEPMLRTSGWGVVADSKILREYYFTDGKLQIGGKRGKPLKADYVLIYRGRKLAVIEAKNIKLKVGEGVAQAKNYAEKLYLDTCFASNGKEIYQICMQTGKEGLIDAFPAPDELWCKTFPEHNIWRDKFNEQPFEIRTKSPRFYQETAVNNVLAAIADEKQRILLTLATGSGKTFIAFQITWKLFQTRWNLQRDGKRHPRILFLADRNILADQAYNDFSAFPEDAMVRIKPDEIRKKGSVPTNASIFFTIFQTFMSGKNNTPYFGEYPSDFFDLIIIDECHRGGANDEGNWRGILEYFAPAVQLGLTATPKRKYNIDTYSYFGEPVYIYSLKEGINDGFLTPFKVRRIQTTLDEYLYTSDDEIIEGEVEIGKIYTETNFNKIIVIKEREAKRVNLMLAEINQQEKTIVFCANQEHAAAIRDLINQFKDSKQPNYCVRVTANDGELGEQYLREFRDNEKMLPTILTTSQKLSTGIDARNIRNIVLMRPINNIIEFKQIIGRGTRLFEGKAFFTIYDFVGAYQYFLDPEWDGEPIEKTIETLEMNQEFLRVEETLEPYIVNREEFLEANEPVKKKKLKIKLNDGKEREIQHMATTFFWGADGKPMSAAEFLKNLYGKLPSFFCNEAELREIWSNPTTRQAFLAKLDEAGYGSEELRSLQILINADKSDLFDVLEYVAFAIKPITRNERVFAAQNKIFAFLNYKQKEFLEFVLSKYIEGGVEELAQEKLPFLLELKYHSIHDAVENFGSKEVILNTFIDFQKYLYIPIAAQDASFKLFNV